MVSTFGKFKVLTAAGMSKTYFLESTPQKTLAFRRNGGQSANARWGVIQLQLCENLEMRVGKHGPALFRDHSADVFFLFTTEVKSPMLGNP
jgi:hypothetical protein